MSAGAARSTSPPSSPGSRGCTARSPRRSTTTAAIYGVAILSRFPIERMAIHRLPGEPDREQRLAAAAEVTVNGRAVTFVTTHLHPTSTPSSGSGRRAA